MRSKKQSPILLLICTTLLLATAPAALIEDMDYGDCPQSYSTLLADNGARHGLGDPNLYLGDCVDLEIDGRPTADANGDDANGVPDDEDGIFFLTDIRQGESADVNVIASKNGLLDAWLDFNADGVFDDASEQIFTSFPLNSGSNILTFNVPSTLLGDDPTLESYARFRFSSAGGLDPNGSADDGKVEDCIVQIELDCLIGGNAHANEYNDWVAWGKPDCWCYDRQCRGDADGIPKLMKWIGGADLTILRTAFLKTDAELALVPWGICADFDHKRILMKRVQAADLAILRHYFLKNSVPLCDQADSTNPVYPSVIYTGPYNFWTSP